LLEVEAIRADLGFRLLQHDVPASVPPAAGVADLRAEQADGKQRYSFSE